MLNFNLVNKALLDDNLSDKGFRLLYFIANSIGLSGEDEITMYNDHIMSTLKWSRSTVIRSMNELVSKGYIKKKTGVNEGNKKPNRLKLSVKYDTEFGKSECQNRTKVSVKSDTLYNSTENNNSSRQQEKLMKTEIAKRNEYITSTYNKLEQKLNYLYTVKTRYIFNAMNKEIEDVFKDAKEHEQWFTEAQWEKLCRYADRWEKIENGKLDYFNNVIEENPCENDEEYQQYQRQVEKMTAGVALVNV